MTTPIVSPESLRVRLEEIEPARASVVVLDVRAGADRKARYELALDAASRSGAKLSVGSWSHWCRNADE